MTNEELDNARGIEAIRIYDLEQDNFNGHGLAHIAARLAREGWTPPVVVDPDAHLAKKLSDKWSDNDERAIKEGRALAAAEAKPGTAWIKHDGSAKSPVAPSSEVICRFIHGTGQTLTLGEASHPYWPIVTHYAIITPPEDAA